jgi:ATP-dependent RNA circularization protein (DNA/RNA ligase family)
MITYPKIDSIFKRDDNGRFTEEYARPEFEYLKNNEWIFTEKVDGTNIRIGWDGEKIEIGGRTENAQIPTFLYEFLTQTFKPVQFADFDDIVLFGEGYGRKINKGGKYIPDGVGFILFDVKIGEWWLRYGDVVDIANGFGIPVVPVIGYATLEEACTLASAGFKSVLAETPAEGIVLKPSTMLFARDGSRIITKVKTKDFR